MARVNVYLPDELAASARAAGVNVSALTQQALRAQLAAAATDRWLDGLAAMPGVDIEPEHVLRALDEARDEFGERS